MEKMEQDYGLLILQYSKGIFAGGVVALGVCLGILVIGALLLAQGMIAMDYLYQMTLVGCAIGSFAGGRWAICQCKHRGLIVGILVGACLTVLCIGIGILLFHGSPSAGGLGIFLASIGGGGISSFWRRKTKGKGKKKRRK